MILTKSTIFVWQNIRLQYSKYIQQRKGLQIAYVPEGRHGPASGDLAPRKSFMLKNQILLRKWRKIIMRPSPSVLDIPNPNGKINMWWETGAFIVAKQKIIIDQQITIIEKIQHMNDAK